MTRRPDGPDDRAPLASPREWALWTSFFPMEGELWQWLGRRLRDDTGLSEADWQVLDALGNTPGHSLRAFELAGRISFSKSRLHQHAGRMAGRGLLEQNPSPEDGRGTVVVLTAEGLACFRRAQTHRARHIREALLDALAPEEVDTLIALSTKIRDNLRRLEAGT
ncbi:DNA-binding MarR family transcriptional regulator [Nocardia transvalensis]|uniref:DNA-binding MarR family transcriptional regulator n=1 Tax=Nocardia transvalensis TaxID=37333 RepID=A0A7W9PJE1_9NOCA|nr:MarR family winged helix-turn-helix transcriptional regulator [Nocardia transvalensis]MBB5916568.1 DNA-binding MarR family transcriptional regulator [Nocardia transvalensis]